jgi:hypothetical protein
MTPSQLELVKLRVRLSEIDRKLANVVLEVWKCRNNGFRPIYNGLFRRTYE